MDYNCIKHTSALLAIVLLASCTKTTPPPAVEPAMASEPKPVPNVPPEPQGPTPKEMAERLAEISEQPLDRSTPQKTLSSWWDREDRIAAITCDYDQHMRKSAEEWINAVKAGTRKAQKALLAGPADAANARAFEGNGYPCTNRSYERKISANSKKSDTEVAVNVQILNTTPIPESLKLEGFWQTVRREGKVYRYTLQKAEDGWRIARVEQRDYSQSWIQLTPAEEPKPGWIYTDTRY